MSDFDSPWKEAIDLYFERFLEFCFPVVHGSIDWSRGYHYRLFDRYGREPVSVAVLADERPAWKPSEFGYELWGCGLNFWFPTIKLLDYGTRTDDLVASSNPFAIVVLAHLKTLETTQTPEIRQSFKSQLVRTLYERGFERRDVLHLFRFIDWMMDLPAELERQFREDLVRIEQEKHMPYVTSIERMGVERGAREQALRAIEQGLRIKFGDEGRSLLPEIHDLADLQHLERFLEKLWAAERIEDLQPIGGAGT